MAIENDPRHTAEGAGREKERVERMARIKTKRKCFFPGGAAHTRAQYFTATGSLVLDGPTMVRDRTSAYRLAFAETTRSAAVLPSSGAKLCP